MPPPNVGLTGIPHPGHNDCMDSSKIVTLECSKQTFTRGDKVRLANKVGTIRLGNSGNDVKVSRNRWEHEARSSFVLVRWESGSQEVINPDRLLGDV